MTATITQIERARDFLEAAQLSDDWAQEMGKKHSSKRPITPPTLKEHN